MDFAGASPEQLRLTLEMVFVFCYAWGIGGGVTAESQVRQPHGSRGCSVPDALASSQGKFAGFLADQMGELQAPPNVFDCVMRIKERQWQPWYGPVSQRTRLQTSVHAAERYAPTRNRSSVVPEFKYNPEAQYFTMMVPTVDTVRYSFLLETCLVRSAQCSVCSGSHLRVRAMQSVERSTFFTGSTGVGKVRAPAPCLAPLALTGWAATQRPLPVRRCAGPARAHQGEARPGDHPAVLLRADAGEEDAAHHREQAAKAQEERSRALCGAQNGAAQCRLSPFLC